MKFLNISKLVCIFVAISQMAFAENGKNDLGFEKVLLKNSKTMTAKNHHNKNIIIISGSSGSQYVVPISADSTVSLSSGRNFGEKEGNIKFTPKGAKIIEPGDYWVDFSIDLSSQSSADTLILNVILKQNDDFDPDDPLNVSSKVTIPSPGSAKIQASGALINVKKRTNLSIVAVNTGGDSSVLVSNWKMTLYKIKR